MPAFATKRPLARTNELCLIGPARARLRNDRRYPDKTIGRQRVDSKLVVSLVCKSIAATQTETPGKSSSETDDETIVCTLIPWTKRPNWAGREMAAKTAGSMLAKQTKY